MASVLVVQEELEGEYNVLIEYNKEQQSLSHRLSKEGEQEARWR